MNNVGSIMQQGKESAVRGLVNLAGVLVYVAGIIYAEVHGYALLSRGVDPSMILWATVGIIALGISALVLPLGLHHSFHSPMQRYAAYGFYALDLGLLIFNAIADYLTRTGGALPGWLDMYMVYVLPATPIIAACGWSLLALLDPGQRERGMVETLKASTREALAARIAEQAKSIDVSAAVDAAAADLARDVITATLGASAARASRKALPAGESAAPQRERQSRAVYVSPLPRRLRSNGQVYNAESDPANFTDPSTGQKV